jgi:hypothetical protein
MMQEVTRIRIARSRLKRDGTIAILECKGDEYAITLAWLGVGIGRVLSLDGVSSIPIFMMYMV